MLWIVVVVVGRRMTRSVSSVGADGRTTVGLGTAAKTALTTTFFADFFLNKVLQHVIWNDLQLVLNHLCFAHFV